MKISVANLFQKIRGGGGGGGGEVNADRFFRTCNWENIISETLLQHCFNRHNMNAFKHFLKLTMFRKLALLCAPVTGQSQ